MSFVVAVSSDGIEGIMASNNSINSKNFKWFINDVFELLKSNSNYSSKVWIIMDNSRVHTSDECRGFFKKLRIKWITIPPYSPQLNPTEKLIAVIKKKLHQCWISRKSLNLNLIKTFIDESSEVLCQQWIKSAREETYKKMKIMNIY